MQAALIIVILIRTVWTFTIFFGTAYLVFFRGHSGWWFVLAIVLIGCASGDITMTTKSERK